MDLRTNSIKYLVIHHTAGNEENTQAVRQEHLNKGWGDIGYNAVVEEDGTVGIGRDVKYIGAHSLGKAPGETLNMNNIGYGLCHIGNFDIESMSDVQFNASVHKANEICRQFNIPLIRVRRHSDDAQTACPGKNFPWTRYLAELDKLLKGGNDVLDVAVLLFSKEDYWAGYDVAAKNGNCAIFVRSADKSVPADAMSANRLIVIGGATTKHSNEVLLSGQTKYDTAAVVGKYLG